MLCVSGALAIDALLDTPHVDWVVYAPFTRRDETQHGWAFRSLNAGWDAGERRNRKGLPRGNPVYCRSVTDPRVRQLIQREPSA
jgi:hypothetical protein